MSIRPESMSGRGFASYRSNNGRGGTSRGSLISTSRDRLPSPGSNELSPGNLILGLHAADISPSDRHATISDFECIASYNWLDSSDPIILVPGMSVPDYEFVFVEKSKTNIAYCKGSPAIWSPPVHLRKLEPDKGEVFIDQNAARYSSFPLEPMFRAIYECNPEVDLAGVHAVICRNTMAKLFEFVTTNLKSFEIDVEIIGCKAVFIRKERKTTEFIDAFRGFGHTFPNEFTRWDNAVKGSSSHHRVAQYEFAGLKYLVRFESDGYEAENAGPVETVSSWRRGDMTDPANTTTLLSSSDSFTIGEKRPTSGHGLVVRKGGSEIDQATVIEIKTRAAQKGLDLKSVLPRLWLSQTPKLVAAYHTGGRFDNVKVLDMRKDLGKWEEQNSENLQKLDAVIRLIIKTVKDSNSKKCRVKRADSRKLEIWELDTNYQCALPDDLYYKLQDEAIEGEDESEDYGRDYEDFYESHDGFYKSEDFE